MNEIIIKEFESTKVEMAEFNGEPMFEIYSTGMALGYLTSNGFAYKQRIDKVIENAEIIPTSHGVKSYFTEENLYDFMLESKTEKVNCTTLITPKGQIWVVIKTKEWLKAS